MLLGQGRSLLLFFYLVNWGISQASCLVCWAFKFSSKCVNHKMHMLSSACKSGLGIVSRAYASGKLNHPLGSLCHDTASLCHSLASEASCLPLWTLSLKSCVFESTEHFCWRWQKWPSSKHEGVVLAWHSAFLGKRQRAVFPSVITLVCLYWNELIYTSEGLTHCSLGAEELRKSIYILMREWNYELGGVMRRNAAILTYSIRMKNKYEPTVWNC